MASGGAVPNYEENSAEQVWNLWTIEQREHFISDHFGVKTLESDYQNKDWDDLPSNIRVNVEIHLLQGQYKDGGEIPDFKIFEGYDHFKGKSVYRVMGVENDYVGEWHKDMPDAQKELDDLCKECDRKMADGGEITTHVNWKSLSLYEIGNNIYLEYGDDKGFHFYSLTKEQLNSIISHLDSIDANPYTASKYLVQEAESGKFVSLTVDIYNV